MGAPAWTGVGIRSRPAHGEGRYSSPSPHAGSPMPQHTQRRADDLTPPPAPDDPRPAPLRMESEEFRRAGYALVDAVAGFLASVPARPVTPGAPPRGRACGARCG